MNIHSIPFQEVRDFFMQAERLVKNFFHSPTKIDITNPIISSYTNGIELYLDKTITTYFKQHFIDMYGEDCKRIPENDWKNLHIGLRSVFKGKQITLGTWEDLMEKFQQTGNNALLNSFKACLPFKDVDTVLETVRKATEFLTPIRNPSLHGKIIPWEEFSQSYPQIIRIINELIDTLTE
ncbi:MAG: hypothetical protein ACFE9L_22015 [Candidatus Hodarchaeota archaeon]